MKIELDLTELGAAISTAPAEVVAVSQAAVTTLRRSMPWGERLTEMADKALEDVLDSLEYEVQDDGTKKSKISENARQRYNLWMMEMHPDNVRNKQTPITVTIDASSLKGASVAAREMDKRKAIDVTAERIEG